MTDGETKALDVEPTLTHVNSLDAAEVLHTLQVGLILVGDFVLVARANLVDVELPDNRISSACGPYPIGKGIEAGDVRLLKLVQGTVVGLEFLLQDVLVVPEPQVVEGSIQVAQEDVGLGTEQEGFLAGELVADHVNITDTGNLVGVLELLPAVATQDITIVIATIEVAAEARHQTRPRGARAIDGTRGSITMGPEAIAKRTQPGVVGIDEHVVTGTLNTGVVAGSLIFIIEFIGQIPEVVTHGSGVIALERCGSILNHLLILTLGKIEAGSKSIGSSDVEVILGHIIEVIAHISQTDQQVSLDFVVGLLQGTTLVVRLKAGLGLGCIGDTEFLLAEFRTTIRHTEDLCQNIVVIGANQVSLTLDGCQTCFVAGIHGFAFDHARSLNLIHFLDNGIGSSNSCIVTLPNSRRRILLTDIVSHILPGIELLVIPVGRRVVKTDTCSIGRVQVVNVVTRQLAHNGVAVIGIGRNEQLLELIKILQIDTGIGDGLEEVLTRTQTDKRHCYK